MVKKVKKLSQGEIEVIDSSDGGGKIMSVPLIALKNLVLFPNTLVPLLVGRSSSLEAVYEAMLKDKLIFAVTQVNPSDQINISELYNVGVLSNILHISKNNEDNARILMDGSQKARLIRVYEAMSETNMPFFMADIRLIEEESEEDDVKVNALRNSITKALSEYNNISGKAEESTLNLTEIKHPYNFAYTVSAILNIDLKKKQKLLEETDLKKCLTQIYKYLIYEIESLKSEKKIQEEVRKRIAKHQKEYYLNEQIKTVQDELRKLNPDKDNSDYGRFQSLLKKTKLPKLVQEKAQEEIKKLSSNSTSIDATVTKSYLDFLFQLPWNSTCQINKDVEKASEILNKSHSVLSDIKKRILEYIAIHARSDKVTGNVLCLFGPPGVGKTSLARSIAQAMGRPFVKISLGGLRNESEIRGHRKTYVGAFAGKILRSLLTVKVNNPVILLDEIDKMGDSYNGDPYSALLEVLDPEQNKEFNDHYLEVSFDLSKVIFIATANTLDMPRPLKDRMEIVHISGYSDVEKMRIFEEHLLAEVIEENTLTNEEIEITKESAKDIITYYTRESGVRSLKRQLSRICRKIVVEISKEPDKGKVVVNPGNLKHYLGIRPHKYGLLEEKNEVGVVMGLAYTEAGGDVLTIEAIKMAGGKGEIEMTGKLGDVMKESVKIAFSFWKSISAEFGADREELNIHNIHMHFPEGATPKDGPSAGLAITTALTSLFANKPVRRDVAMTGEVTLHGKALEIGGLKEKLMSAVRSGIKTVFIPKDNEKDLEEIPSEIVGALEIIPVQNVREVLEKAIIWDAKTGS
jgi:ATP-dependent Lon protease